MFTLFIESFLCFIAIFREDKLEQILQKQMQPDLCSIRMYPHGLLKPTTCLNKKMGEYVVEYNIDVLYVCDA